MSHIDDHIRRIEEITLPELRRDLDAFETGMLRIGKRDESGRMIDLTADHADGIRRAIAEYESILTSLRNGEIP
jgi:hypothetical protein